MTCFPPFSPHTGSITRLRLRFLKCESDILTALDSGDLAVLTLLDLSAAFDSVNHSTLLRRLQTTYGLNGAVINWFTFYLCSRLQHMRILSTSSAPSAVPFRCHRGRSSDRSCFSCTTPTCCNWSVVIYFIRTHSLTTHRFTDSAIHPQRTFFASLSAFVNDASTCLKSKLLLLNPAKTEILWCSSPRHGNLIPSQALSIGNTSVLPVSAVRDLRVYVDTHVTMKNHVTVTVRSCFSALRQIPSVR